jgi:hypothetical protein
MHYKARPGFLTVKEAAVRYQVSRAKLHRLVQGGRVHSEKDPRDERATLLRTEDLEGFFGFPREGAGAMLYDTVADGRDIVAGRLTAEACARMDAVRTRIAAKHAVRGNIVETIRAEREKRTAQITEAVSPRLGDPAE